MKLMPLVIFSLLIYLQCFVRAESSSEEAEGEENGSSSDESINEALLEEDPDFDLLIFTQRWPITACYEWREKSSDHICGLPSANDTWTIHGIWPTKLNTIGPSFCNKTAVFNVTELSAIEPQLEQFWINVEKNKPFDSLWRHEWLKHGTCAAAVLVQLNTEDKYFGQGLNWLLQHTMTYALGKGGITPGGNYTVVMIHNVLMDRFQKNAAIECYHDRETKLQFLNEIRICFNKNLELTDCDGILYEDVFISRPAGKLITNCNINKPIFYPGKVPMSRYEKMRMSPYDLHNKYLEKKAEENPMMRLLVNIYKFMHFKGFVTWHKVPRHNQEYSSAQSGAPISTFSAHSGTFVGILFLVILLTLISPARYFSL